MALCVVASAAEVAYPMESPWLLYADIYAMSMIFTWLVVPPAVGAFGMLLALHSGCVACLVQRPFELRPVSDSVFCWLRDFICIWCVFWECSAGHVYSIQQRLVLYFKHFVV